MQNMTFCPHESDNNDEALDNNATSYTEFIRGTIRSTINGLTLWKYKPGDDPNQ